MESQNKQSVLEKHSINLEDKLNTEVTFYSYYTYDSPIYYELESLVKIFKFPNEASVIASIPPNWVRTVESLDDSKFEQKFPPNALFTEASGIAFLISICENRMLSKTITNLYNICIRKCENDRVKRLNTRLVQLNDDVKVLVSEVERMKIDHSRHNEKFTKKQSLIHDTVKLLNDHHESIQETLKKLLHKL